LIVFQSSNGVPDQATADDVFLNIGGVVMVDFLEVANVNVNVSEKHDDCDNKESFFSHLLPDNLSNRVERNHYGNFILIQNQRNRCKHTPDMY
jgi:hypothetical protein